MSLFSRAFHRVVNAVESNPVVNTLTRAAATTFGGPIGGAAASALLPMHVPHLIDDSGATASADIPQLPSLPQSETGTQVASAGAGGTAAVVFGAASAAGGVIRSVGGKIVGFLLKDGSKLSLAGAAAMASRFGLPAVAAAIGIAVTDLAVALFHHKKHRRHHRGITSSDMRRTRATIRKVTRLHAQLSHLAARSVHRAGRGRFIGTGRTEVIRNG